MIQPHPEFADGVWFPNECEPEFVDWFLGLLELLEEPRGSAVMDRSWRSVKRYRLLVRGGRVDNRHTFNSKRGRRTEKRRGSHISPLAVVGYLTVYVPELPIYVGAAAAISSARMTWELSGKVLAAWETVQPRRNVYASTEFIAERLAGQP